MATRKLAQYHWYDVYGNSLEKAIWKKTQYEYNERAFIPHMKVFLILTKEGTIFIILGLQGTKQQY